MTARVFLIADSLTADGHGWREIIEPLSVLIRVDPWPIRVGWYAAAANFLRLFAADRVSVVGWPSNRRLA